MERELDAIKDVSLQYGLVNLLTKFEDILEWCPSSSSGKYHKNDSLLATHLRRTFRFAHTLAEHEHLPNPNFDITIASALIHDIGKCTSIQLTYPGEEVISANPAEWKQYQDKYWVYKPGWENHPLTGAMEIMKIDDFPFKEQIVEIIITHHHLWYPNIMTVKCLEGRIVSMADYLASRDYVLFDKGWSKYER
jgi:response regulator RpfG family c-di-GMP phosphodiesterase